MMHDNKRGDYESGIASQPAVKYTAFDNASLKAVHFQIRQILILWVLVIWISSKIILLKILKCYLIKWVRQQYAMDNDEE